MIDCKQDWLPVNIREGMLNIAFSVYHTCRIACNSLTFKLCWNCCFRNNDSIIYITTTETRFDCCKLLRKTKLRIEYTITFFDKALYVIVIGWKLYILCLVKQYSNAFNISGVEYIFKNPNLYYIFQIYTSWHY